VLYKKVYSSARTNILFVRYLKTVVLVLKVFQFSSARIIVQQRVSYSSGSKLSKNSSARTKLLL